MSEQVSQFRPGAAPLTDIAARLRILADEIEAGAIAPRTVVVVRDDPVHIVAGACYGEMPDRFGLAGMLKAAADKASTGAWR